MVRPARSVLMTPLALVLVSACRPTPAPEPPASAPSLRVRVGCPGPGPGARPRHVLATVEGPLVLRNGSERGSLESWPCVERDGRAFALDERETNDETSVLGWEHVELLDGRTVVGVLDTNVESPGHELRVIASTDAGRTWAARGIVVKPHYMATFFDLTRVGSSIEHLRLTLHLDDCAGCEAAPGYYEAETRDGGRTWTPLRQRGEFSAQTRPRRRRCHGRRQSGRARAAAQAPGRPTVE